MGGSIAVVVRDFKGVVHKQGRWTNGLSTCFNDLRLFRDDQDFLTEYLTRESCYGPWTSVAPLSYGLVLADCKNRVLLDWQGYTGQLGGKFYEFAFNPTDRSEDGPPRVSDEDSRDQAVAFFEKGLAQHVVLIEAGSKGEKERTIPVKSIEDVDKIAAETRARNKAAREYFHKLFCDISPWVHIRYDETEDGLDQMKAKILELGFKLTPAEKGLWTKFKKERFSDE